MVAKSSAWNLLALIALCWVCLTRAQFECSSYDDYKEDLDFCAPFVFWDVQPSVAASASSIDQAAADRYADYLAGWRASPPNVTNDCLAYQAYFQCVNAFRKCHLGERQGICEFVCKEVDRRCDDVRCDTGGRHCSGAPSVVLSFAVVGGASLAAVWTLLR